MPSPESFDEDDCVFLADDNSDISIDDLMESIEEFIPDGSVIDPMENNTLQGIKLKYSAELVSAGMSGKCDPSLVPFVDIKIR